MKKTAVAAVAALLLLGSACGGGDDDTKLDSAEKGVAASMATAITKQGGLLDTKDATCVADAFVADRGLTSLQKSKAVDADNKYQANGALSDASNAKAYTAALTKCLDEDEALATITKNAEAAYGAQTQGILSAESVTCLMTSFTKAAGIERLFSSRFLKDTGEFDGTGSSYDKETATDFATALTKCVDYPQIQAQDAVAKNKKLSVTKLAACLRKAIPTKALTETIVARLTSSPDAEALVAASNAEAVACEKTSLK